MSDKQLTFIDWFAGIGGFRRGMELAGHKCIGFCEFDKFAVASYTSMHLITDEQREFLSTLDLKKRQKEILKEEYRNGEWYAKDITEVKGEDVPKSDCWCFGFPCQDISIANTINKKGFQGDRSSLFFRIMSLVRQIPEEKRPSYLLIENVKNLLGVNGGWDFARLLVELDRGGYNGEWELLNSKDFGAPQSRERLFIIGHNRNKYTAKVFPVRKNENKIKILQIAEYDVKRKNANEYRVYSPNGLSPTLTTVSGGGRMPFIKIDDIIRKLTPKECFRLQGWTDDYFEKAQFVNSDSQLYKQAGNGVTVNVVYDIAKKIR